jgi:opacity protein-like surface antigen
MRRYFILFCAAVSITVLNSADSVKAQGKLSRIRESVRPTTPAVESPPPTSPPTSTPPTEDATDSESDHDHHHYDGSRFYNHRSDDENSFGGKVLGAGLMAGLSAASSPFWGPHEALEDESSDKGYFPDFPYHETDGSLENSKSARGFHDTLIILRGQYGNDFGGLSHANGRLIVDTASRFGFDTEFFYRYEDLTRGSDHLWMGDANLTYRFAQNDYWQFRTGVGVNWLSDRFGTEDGFNFTYGLEYFPTKPWVVTADLDWGKIGNAKLFHGRTTIGVTRNGWGVFTGYDYLRLDKVRLHTWINGIEYRF